MSTKVDLSIVTYFKYTSDLAIEPIIKARHDDTFYVLKTTKDENVDFVNGEIKVVTTEVTALKAKHSETEQLSNAVGLKTEIEKIAALAKANKASLNGQVIIQGDNEDEDGDCVFRILVTDNRVEVQEGKPAAMWPDGTTSELPQA